MADITSIHKGNFKLNNSGKSIVSKKKIRKKNKKKKKERESIVSKSKQKRRLSKAIKVNNLIPTSAKYSNSYHFSVTC